MAGKTLLEATDMSTIRLEHDKFDAAPMLGALLSDRMMTVSDAGR